METDAEVSMIFLVFIATSLWTFQGIDFAAMAETPITWGHCG
jgi:hypothetical protein